MSSTEATKTGKKDDKPQADKAAEAKQAAPVPPPTLKDSSTASLGKVFKGLSERANEGLKVYRPTLAKLNELISKFHVLGVDDVGVELATFDRLREYNLMNKPGSDDHSLYSILSVYDARFLVRIEPDQKIVTYTENLNKPSLGVQFIDTEEFWYKTERSSGGSVKVIKSEPKFNEYDLKVEEDAVNFLSAIAETAAALLANQGLREEDVNPAAKKSAFAKNRLLPKP